MGRRTGIITISLVILTTLLAGCSDEEAPHISGLALSAERSFLHEGATSVVMRFHVLEKRDGAETPIPWSGTIQTVWTVSQSEEDSEWTHDLRVRPSAYQTDPNGPLFETTLSPYELPRPDCYSVTASLLDADRDTVHTATDDVCIHPPTWDELVAEWSDGDQRFGPSLGLVSSSYDSSTSQWTVKVSSATHARPLEEYLFTLHTPSHGRIIAEPRPTPDQFLDGYEMTASWDHASPTNRSVATNATGATDDTPGPIRYQLVWTEVDGNARWSVGDWVRIRYDDTADDVAFGDPFPHGEHMLEIEHLPSGIQSGMLPRSF